MFDKVDSKLNLPQMDKKVLDFWDANSIFEKSITARENAKPFVFYEGPPGMNGLPHIGHGSTRIYKDTVLRYYAMKGRKVLRKAGWDAHGLPVEQKAEKDLGIKNKAEIETFGVQKFVEQCKKIINLYEKEWRIATRKLGFWVNFDDAYITCSDDYIESVWWSLKKLFEQGDIYEGYRVGPYCPRCGTSLASHEVAQGYQTVKDRTIYVRFEIKNKTNSYFLAWTTTPWTLPSNVALAVNPEIEYIEIEVESGEHYILAKNLVGKLFEDYQVVRQYKGKDLEGMEYKPIFDIPLNLLENKKAYYVTCADYVTISDGTGIVHIAPAFGIDDSNVGNQYNLPFVKLINDKGCFDETLPKYAGKRNIVANDEIIEDLKARGIVEKEQLYEHEYPHCWRCHTPLIYCARTGWFVRMSKYREQMLKNNATVDWHPESVRDGRMGNFLANAIDWNLSRDRYWGTPLNIWKCDKCGKLHSVGSRKELCELTGKTEIKDLHKPYIDEFTFKCECGGTMKRVPQVIDCWYDSGAMPFAQWHYPFENKEKFEEQFPADFICEAQDQTRGWFYSLQAIGTTVFNTSPYKACVMSGHIYDKNGLKMSKSLGNVVDINGLIDKYGADTVRFYFCSNSAPWLSQKLDEDGILEVQRKTISTLWNTYAFFVLYANIDDFKPTKDILSCKLTLMDKWLLSQLNALMLKIEKYMQEFNFTDSTRAIADFIDVLSNWYVRRSRERFWVDGVNEDKTAAFNCLYHTLVELTKICAPFMPFLSDNIYQNLTKNCDNEKLSVHLTDFPTADLGLIDEKLNSQMKEVIDIVALGRAGRNASNIKNRQPIANMFIYSSNKIDLNEQLIEIIADDLNVKNVKFIENPTDYINFELKPQLKTLGPKYGKNLSLIREYLANCDAYSVVEKLQNNETITVNEELDIVLNQDDVLIYPHSKPDFTAETNAGITVILDTVLTKELIDEGNAREFISKVQNMRKEASFEVEDRINVWYETDDSLTNTLKQYADFISKIILAESMQVGNLGEFKSKADINGTECNISISKVK